MTEFANPISQRERAKAERRKRIVDSARQLINEHGFQNVSIEEIAAHAKVGQATVYNLFGNKNSILAALFQEEIKDFNLLVEQRKPESALSKLFMIAEFVAEMVWKNPQFYRAMAYAVNEFEHDIAVSVSIDRIRYYTEVVQEAIEAGDLRRGTPADLLGTALGHMVAGAALSYAGTTSRDDILAHINFGISLLLKGYTSRRASPVVQSALSDAAVVLHSGKRFVTRSQSPDPAAGCMQRAVAVERADPVCRAVG